MTPMYESELQAAEDAFVRTLIDHGVPQQLWPTYARLAAERIACMVADQIVGDAHQKSVAERNRDREQEQLEAEQDYLYRLRHNEGT